jgi:hypothetical protein
MSDFELTSFLAMLAAAVILLLILREVNIWYWKINLLIINQRTANLHLERIAKQLGCSEGNMIMLEEISTGKTIEGSLHKWLESDDFEKNKKLYRVVGLTKPNKDSNE